MTCLLNQIFPKVFLINLDRRTDRLEQFDKQAKELGIDYERFKAVELENPIEGCRESHVTILKENLDTGLFIFEDDAYFVEDFNAKFEEAWKHLPEDWDMVYLGANLIKYEKVNDYWVRSLQCCSTHAYGVKPENAWKLLHITKQHEGHIDLVYSMIHPKLKVYAARPTLVYQAPGMSDLAGKFMDYSRLYFEALR